MELRSPLIVLIYIGLAAMVDANMYDCWDPEKLAKMKFKESRDEQNDPSLSSFSKLLRCIQKNQGQVESNFGEMDVSQWEHVARSGQFPPGWNYPNGQPPPSWGRPGQGTDNMMQTPDYGRRPSQQPHYPPQQPQYPPQQPQYPVQNARPTGQPRPGVHPEDWNNSREPPNFDNRWSTVSYDEEDRDDDVGTGRGDRKGRKKNRNSRRKERPQDDNGNMLVGPSIPTEIIDDRRGPWNDKGEENPHQQQPVPGAPVGRDFIMVDDEETSLHRKYGYAIMALSVVVLAVLMVSSIFCCNSSNSTMNQPAGVQQVPISQIDNYSIYSYKQGAMPADTLLSTGTLGGTSLRTETLCSTQSHASPQPQYRVSDINPDYNRRYNDTVNRHY